MSQRLIRTPDQRLRVFVSSTLQEVVDERKAAREAIERLRLAPVMFELGARPHPPAGRLRESLHDRSRHDLHRAALPKPLPARVRAAGSVTRVFPPLGVPPAYVLCQPK